MVLGINLWGTPGDCLQLNFDATDDNPVSPAVQSVFSLLLCPFIYPLVHQFVYEDVMGDSVKASLNLM